MILEIRAGAGGDEAALFAGELLQMYLRYAANQTGALEGADALIIVTEWKEFRSPDFDTIKAKLKNPLIRAFWGRLR